MSFALRYSKNEVRLGHWNRQTHLANRPSCLRVPPQLSGIVLKAFSIQENLSSERAAFRMGERAISASPAIQKPLHQYLGSSKKEKMDVESKRMLQNERRLRKHERLSSIQESRDFKYEHGKELNLDWAEYEQELWEDEFLRKLSLEEEVSIEADATVSSEEEPHQSWTHYEEDVDEGSGELDSADEWDLEYSQKHFGI
jgi:hypothetical protein